MSSRLLDGPGSCTGSQVILELLLNGNSPAGIVLCQADEIIALGAIVAEELFSKKLPVLCLEAGTQKDVTVPLFKMWAWRCCIALLSFSHLLNYPDRKQK